MRKLLQWICPFPFSSSEEAPTSPEVAEVDPHSHEEMSDSSEAWGTGDQARHYP